jgi:glycosyltransferase involved in cell wall biosynthesis
MWNEEDWVEEAYLSIREAMERHDIDGQIVLATDGCTDETVPVIQELIRDDPALVHFDYPGKLGRGRALKRALKRVDTPYIVYMDSDLATDLSLLPRLIEHLEDGADLVTGSRLMQDSACVRSRKRDIFSRIYNLLARGLFRSKIHDHQCGFKGFRRDSILSLINEVESTGWFWDTEILIRAQKAGMRVDEFPASWKDREEDASKVNVWTDAKNMGTSLIRLRLILIPDGMWQMAKFAMVGVTNTLLSLFILIVLDATIGRGNWGYYFAYAVGAVNSYILNSRFTFQKYERGKASAIRFVGFVGTAFVGMILYVLTAQFVEVTLGQHYIFAGLSGTVVNFLFQFLVSKVAIFADWEDRLLG